MIEPSVVAVVEIDIVPIVVGVLVGSSVVEVLVVEGDIVAAVVVEIGVV